MNDDFIPTAGIKDPSLHAYCDSGIKPRQDLYLKRQKSGLNKEIR
jgi:hypothetical protein